MPPGATGDVFLAPQAAPTARLFGLLASTWLLIGWTVTMGLWIVAEVSPILACPHGQSCVKAPVLTSGWKIAAWIAVWLAGIVVLLLVRRRDLGRPRVALHASPRRARWVLIIAGSLVGVLAGAHLLLLAPVAKTLFCAQPIRINRYMAYPLNCDSHEFMLLARHPRVLLHFDNVRQSRPGYVALGAALTRILGPVASHLGLDRDYGQTSITYIPLILINLVAVVAAVVLLAWILGRFGTPVPVVLALGSLLVLNDLTKAFFWTPHQQMFTLLVPLGTIVLGRWIFLRQPPWWAAILLGAALGLASLVYANVLITVGVLALIMLARRWRGVVNAAALGLTFAVAPVAWIWLCKRLSGSYYNQEAVRYHEFIWLPLSLQHGWRGLGTGLEIASVASMRGVLGANALVLAVLAGLVLAAVWAGVKLTAVTTEDTAILVASGLTVAVSLVFGWGIGIIATRIMFAVFPAILVLAGWVATRFAVKSRVTLLVASYGLVIVAIANAVHEVVVHGPYS
jgi:hypothetical protein